MVTNELLIQLGREINGIVDDWSYRLHVVVAQQPVVLLEDRDNVSEILDNFATNMLLYQRYVLQPTTPPREPELMEVSPSVLVVVFVLVCLLACICCCYSYHSHPTCVIL